MDTGQILKKAWSLAWRYRALWLFGALMALTVSNSLWLGVPWANQDFVANNQLILSDVATIKFPGEGVTIDLSKFGSPVVRIQGLDQDWYKDLSEVVNLGDIWAVIVTTGVMLLLSGLLAILLRYTSEAALIRMVDENERTDKMVSLGRGMRLGWSRVAGKLFLIDLTVALSVILAFGALFTLAVSPLFLLGAESVSENVFSVLGISALSLFGLTIWFALACAVGIVLSITTPVMRRACAVDGMGVWASIRMGFRLLKTRFDKVLLTWLAWLGIRLAWMIAAIPLFIVISPLMLFTLLVGVLVSAVPALLAAGVASLFVSTVPAWIIGAAVGLPLFALVTLSPIIFLNGLVEVFKSNFWTLSYREFRPLASPTTQPVDKVESAELKIIAPAT